MDWITGIQNAIDYIEEHITEELDYEAIARESFSSSFHFQRMFSILCGEHGDDPSSVEFCHNTGLAYVSCSPFRVPIARLAAAQAAIKNPR